MEDHADQMIYLPMQYSHVKQSLVEWQAFGNSVLPVLARKMMKDVSSKGLQCQSVLGASYSITEDGTCGPGSHQPPAGQHVHLSTNSSSALGTLLFT